MNSMTVRRIEVLFFDAMFTLLMAIGGRREMMAKIFIKHLRAISKRLGVKMPQRKGFTRRLTRITARVREVTPPTTDYSRNWSLINCLIAARMLGVREDLILMEEGWKIHQDVLSNSAYYEVPRKIREMLKLAKKLGFRMVIASNQEEKHLLPMLEAFNILQYFEMVLCSDKLGICKPDPEFFKRAYAELDVEPESACYIGNSIRNDLSAAWTGSQVVLIDYEGNLRITETGGGLYLVKVVRNVDGLCDWLMEQSKLPAAIPPLAAANA